MADVVFPPRCGGCERLGTLFCATCWEDVRPLTPPYCPQCGQPTTAPQRCARCQRTSFEALNGARAAALHVGPMRQAIHRFKYRGETRLARPLAAYMATRTGHRRLRSQVLIPVPLHLTRLARRGYNQSALLAQNLSRSLAIPVVEDAVIRQQATRPQVTLRAADRWRNMANAFRCVHPEAVRGARVLVIDDVMTTGSTLDACAVALKEAGAKEVWGYTLARAVFASAQASPPDHPMFAT